MENDRALASSSSSQTFKNMEDVIRHVDKTGRWQYWITARTGFVLIGISLMLYGQSLFFVGRMQHVCVAYENDEFGVYNNQSLSTNKTEQALTACALPADDENGAAVRRCVKWQYSSPYYGSTMVSDYDLVCDRAYLIPLFQSSAFVGQIFGNLFSGIASDRYGRRPTFLAGYAGLLIVSLLMGFVRSVWWSIILRGFCGVFGIFAWNSMFVICMEIAVPERRHIIGVYSALSWPLGAALASLVPVFVREWRQVCWIMVAIAAATGILPALTIAESPRWLVFHQHTARALKILRNVSKKPSAQLPKDEQFLQVIYRRHIAEQQQGASARSPMRQAVHLLAERRLRARTVMMAVSWVLISFVFFGILYYGANVIPGASPMLILGTMSMGRVIAYPFYVLLFNFFGCRNTLRNMLPVICLLLLGLGLLPIPRGVTWGVLIYGGVYVLTHIVSDLCFAALYIVTGELYPTVLRQTSLGFFSLIGRIGSFGSTFAATLLSPVWLPLPAIIFSIASAVAAIAVLALPRDTDEVALPDTVRDAYLLEESIPMEKRAPSPTTGQLPKQ